MQQLPRFSCVGCFTVAIIVFGGAGELGAQMTTIRARIDVSDPMTLNLTPSPVVAMNRNGDFVVAWSTEVGTAGSGNFDIFAHRFDRTGAELGTVFPVNTFTTGLQGNPSVAFVGTGGDFVIVWDGPDSNYGGIRGNIFDDNDNPLFARDQVINGTEQGVQGKPAVARTDSGFVVAWEHFPIGADGEIRVQSFGSDGVPVGLEHIAVRTPGPSTPDIDVGADGNYAVVWAQAVGPANSDIFARRFIAGAPVSGAAIQVNSFTSGAQNGPRVQVGAGGEFVVAWNAGGPGPQYFLPSFQQFDSGGNKVGGEKSAAETPPSTPNPGLIDPAFVADGSFATVYVGPNADGVTQIAGLLFDDTGNVIDSNPADSTTDEFLVHDPSDPANQQTSATYPRIASDGCGLYVVAYGNNGRFSAAISPHAAATLLRSGPSCVTGSSCADPDDSGSTTVSDALFTLRAAVGSGICALCHCDIDGAGTVTATDALLVLRAAVGNIVAFSCPPCS